MALKLAVTDSAVNRIIINGKFFYGKYRSQYKMLNQATWAEMPENVAFLPGLKFRLTDRLHINIIRMNVRSSHVFLK
ncbi:hypothetical protein QJ48_20840 [Paenibacillus sp. A3]|nr:hypothetical protein QJ48_20840 [Paenibacillus sp. A3]